MDNSAVITLLEVGRTTDSSGTQAESITARRNRYCQIESIGMRETYEALAIGRKPEVKAIMKECSEYTGEQFVLYGGNVYKVLRTYRKGTALELTLEKTTDLKGLI